MNSINTNWRQLGSKFIVLIVLAVAVLFAIVSCSGKAPSKTQGIAPEVVVDYLHKIIEAERSVYTEHVVNRLGESGVMKTSENWKNEKNLPLPAQMLRMAAEESSQDGAFTYRLISPWNINDEQSPKTEFEKKGMENVIKTGEPFKELQTINGNQYFSAIYPDKAVSIACVKCHNNHPVHKKRYPNKFFSIGDVMGGIELNLPLK
ncbi:Tll0287-like domain-containing protein [Limnofasciculus baicalensis]|uniref:DUF3365 domain-containing protein n=1 Tax=Limnofasciculus baicalensis BBK-W-15 TaxID=2699891 RepID=A0AAE3GQB2_9CYAN|nr:DUF3365 domain-containing protein [Limnofasciculus baicalensis]MCP2728097.1 DUF3365 domain-containing protein [Limnofasciculus baicalensis BBK-W-15]